MKKITALLLALILAVASAVPAFAETDQFFSSVSENKSAELVPVEAEEEKIYCDATLDDDFADDSVIVMLKNDVSLELNDYDKYDFNEVNAEKVEDLTSYTVETIQEQRLQLNSLSVNSTATIDEAINDEIVDDYEDESGNNNDYSSFHQIIKLDLKTKSKQAVLDAIDVLEDRDDVLMAEPDYITEICAVPNDSYYSKQWAANKINLPAAWNITTGSKAVTVGVIDTGIKRAHSDLTANVDATLSKSFVDNAPFTDSNGHGTHVAGIIGAVGNNNRGISGTCWNIKLVSLKTKTGEGGYVSDDIKAVEYAQSKGIDIINYSSSAGDSQSFLIAIKNYDGLFVCSAGNDNKNIDNPPSGYTYLYPSVYKLSNVISVAATDENDVFGLLYTDEDGNHYSNYGKSSVNIAAPGCSIYSTYNGNTSDWYYAYMSGTSMAAPYVAGVAALIKSKYPTITNYGMRSAILDGSDKTSYLSGKVKSGARLNAYKAITDVPNHKFTVKYNKNGGTGSTMSDTAVTYGIPVNLKANTYSKTGYKFKGWYAHRQSDNKWYYKGSGGTGWYVEGQQPSGYSKCLYVNKASIAHTSGTRGDVVTMYAQWEPITYTLVFNPNGGQNTMSQQKITYGVNTKISKNLYVKNGYNFDGWTARRTSDNKWYYTNGSSTGWYVEGSEPNGYTKFKYNNQATIAKTSSVDGDKVYMYAQWEPITYTLVFNPNGGQNTMSQQKITYGVNTKISKNLYVKSGYNFDGWTARRTSDNKWYYTNGSSTGWYVEGTEPDGYTKFKYNDQATIAKTSSVDGDKVYMYAQWEPITYTLIFDANGGGGPHSMPQQNITYGQNTKISKNVYIKGGYYFDGWTARRTSDNKWYYTNGSSTGWYVEGTEPDGYTKFKYNDQATIAKTSSVDGDKVYMYAQWAPNSYTIKFDPGDGNGTMADITGYTDIPLTLSSNTFTKQNYSFLGWYLCDEYGYWSCTGDEWLDSGIINKKLYYNTDEVVYQADSDGDSVTAYAQWIKTDTIILGDANLDGEITVDDVTFIQKCLASLNNYSDANKVAADVNRDGEMDINDANLILQYVSGAITGF